MFSPLCISLQLNYSIKGKENEKTVIFGGCNDDSV
jgi:hypothetical protein